MAVTVNGKEGIDLGRLTLRIDRLGIHRPHVTKILEEIGAMMSGEAKLVAKQQDIMETGRLINSISHRISQRQDGVSVTVGPKSIFYARFQEDGAIRTPQSRAAMFARLRELGRIGNRGPRPGFSETIHRPRPFLKPAFDRHAFKTYSMLVDLLHREF